VAASVDAAGGRALCLPADVTSEDDMVLMATTVIAEFGAIGALICCAGIGRLPTASRLPCSAKDLPLAEWQAVLDTNLTGTFLANRAVLPAMLAQGYGQIINCSSSTTPRGLRGDAFGSAYCASKFGVVGMSESLAAEVERHGIRVNVVLPGAVATPMIDNTMLARRYGGAIDAGHFGAFMADLVGMPADTVLVHPHALHSPLPQPS
jgi:NAD(P)-dependent dehydrogenase (short-subunit alcohol dehydrogenase family)